MRQELREALVAAAVAFVARRVCMSISIRRSASRLVVSREVVGHWVDLAFPLGAVARTLVVIRPFVRVHGVVGSRQFLSFFSVFPLFFPPLLTGLGGEKPTANNHAHLHWDDRRHLGQAQRETEAGE